MSTATSTKSKHITVKRRCTVNATGTVVYVIENGDNKRYLVTLSVTGATCTCDAFAKWHKVCYHVKGVLEIESLRGTHICEHGSLAGFIFALPEEKKEEPVEVVVVEAAPASSEDMSVEEKMLEDESRPYEKDLQSWGIAQLRAAIKVEGLSITSHSREPLIAALVEHRRQSLMAHSETKVAPVMGKREQQKQAILDEWKEKYPAMSSSFAKVREEFAAQGNYHSSRAFSLMA